MKRANHISVESEGPVGGGRKVVSVASHATAASTELSKNKTKSFAAMGLSEATLKGIARAGYTRPTPVQRKAIPLALQVGVTHFPSSFYYRDCLTMSISVQGHDLVAMAKTGRYIILYMVG